MREILFRGKRVDNDEWAEGYLVVSNGYINKGKAYILPVVTAFSCDKNNSAIIIGEFIEVIPETVGQDTGLTDKNDKKIFEGDILRVSQNEVVEIYYDECYCQFRARTANGVENAIDYYCGYPVQYEVIGNIHDNSELVEVK